jgi:hypothetical protein
VRGGVGNTGDECLIALVRELPEPERFDVTAEEGLDMAAARLARTLVFRPLSRTLREVTDRRAMGRVTNSSGAPMPDREGGDPVEGASLVGAQALAADCGKGRSLGVACEVKQHGFGAENDGRSEDLAVVDREDALAIGSRHRARDEVRGRPADRLAFGSCNDRLEHREPVVSGDEAKQSGLACGFGEEVPTVPGGALVLQGQNRYLNMPWAWFRRRCEELAVAGVDDLAQPRSRLLSTQRLNTAIRDVAYIDDL